LQPTCARQKIEFLLENLIPSRQAHPRGSTTCSSVTSINSPGEQRPSTKIFGSLRFAGYKSLEYLRFPGCKYFGYVRFPGYKNLVMRSAKLKLLNFRYVLFARVQNFWSCGQLRSSHLKKKILGNLCSLCNGLLTHNCF
jgi:hypothetical protein